MTDKNVKLDAKLINSLRNRGKNSLFFFARGILGFSDLDVNIHKSVCEDLQNYDKNNRALIVLPRDWFKSTIGSVAYPIWRAINNSNVRILIVQNSMSNARKHLMSIKQIFEKNKLFRALYPELMPPANSRWTQESLVVNRSGTYPEGTFEAAGTGTAVTSRHYDLIIEDDTITPDRDALTGVSQQPTQLEIEKAIGFHRLTHPLLLHPTKSQIVVIGTRWAVHDLIGWIMENCPEFKIITKAALEDGKPTWDRFNQEVLDSLSRSLGPYMFACTPGYAGVLMGDFSSKPISDVIVGDLVVGFTLGSPRKSGVTLPTKVVAKGSRVATVVKLTMSSGRTVFCTPDHKWLADPKHAKNRPHLVYREMCNYNGAMTKVWLPKDVNERHKKCQMHFVCEPDVPNVASTNKDVALWLAGLYDGEGSCNVTQGHLTISQSATHNPLVCEGIKHALSALGFTWNSDLRDAFDMKGNVCGLGNVFTLTGGFEARRKFLYQVHPLKCGNIVKSLYGSRFVKGVEEVVSVDIIEKDVVYWLQTETGNYVSQGYASKNSLYLNDPTEAVNQVFKRNWVQYYHTLPGKQLCYCTSVDPAAAAKEESSNPDYNVVLTTAVQPKDGVVYIVKYTRERMNPGELIDAIFEHQRLYKPMVVKVEAISYQRTLCYWIKRRQEKLHQDFYVEEIRSAHASKVDRIRGLQPYFNNGKILMKSEMDALERELLAFPKGAHDDIIDALSAQIDFWETAVAMDEDVRRDKTNADPMSGAVLLEEVHARSSCLSSYPNDIGIMGDNFLDSRLVRNTANGGLFALSGRN